MRSLLFLHDDILGLICDELLGKDALNLALSCGRLHAVAIHRVIAVVFIGGATQLLQFCKLVLDPNRPRAQYLESLEIDGGAFLVDFQACWVQMSPEAVQCFIDLLHNALNIRRLSVTSGFQTLLRYDERIGCALAALRRLDCLEIGVVAEKAITFVGANRWTAIRVLYIQFGYALDPLPEGHDSDLDRIRDDSISFPVLLDTLAQFPHLNILAIGGIGITASFRDIPSYAPPVLATVHTLILFDANLALFDLIDLCPCITMLNAGFHWGVIHDVTDNGLTVPTSQTWPPFRRLALYAIEMTPLVEDRLDEACALRIASDIYAQRSTSPAIPQLLSVLRKVSPVCLDISLVAKDPMPRLWTEVRQAAPRLRYLTLRIHLSGLFALNQLGGMPNALRQLPLIYLSLHLVKIPRKFSMQDLFTESYPSTPDPGTPDSGKVVMKTLPERLAEEIEGLEFLVLEFKGRYFVKPREQEKAVTGVHDDWKYFNWIDDFDHRYHQTIKEGPDAVQAWQILYLNRNGKQLKRLTTTQRNRLVRFVEESHLEELENIKEHLVL
ncbi:hypothetical protein C8Q80DRAFT_1274029 [Daedaleopsis nitida]|nr:hypothetical protein C8Q80DRAFT_1274029 [Daedaleopsis nitida]